jgi:glycosyltransferase involved in cell wall biosynthesis
MEKPVRVMQVLPDFGIGGGQWMAAHLMGHMNCNWFDVTAVSLYPSRETAIEKRLIKQGVSLRFIDKRVGFDPRVYPRIDFVIRELKPHIIHTHLYVLPYVFPLALLRRVPVQIHTVHSLAWKETNLQWLYRIAFKSAVVPVAIASAVLCSITQAYGVAAPLIPNGIPIGDCMMSDESRRDWRSCAGFSQGDVLLVCVARLSESKNHGFLIDTFSRLESRKNVHLLLVGDGPLRSPLEAQVCERELKNRVHFLGNRRDVAQILQASDVFVLASRREGNPLSVMEAMAAGRPVIATAVGGVPELVVDGETGRLIPSGDIVSLANAIDSLVENPEIRQSMGRAAEKRAQAMFDIQLMATAYQELYLSLLSEV